MVPVAGVVVPLIDLYNPVSPPEPSLFGLLAVPVSVALSLSVLPRTHGEAEHGRDRDDPAPTAEVVALGQVLDADEGLVGHLELLHRRVLGAGEEP